ncbi:MAG: 3-phosphoshikimate 1-carboxyvinyltransferase, partial [Alphaproteobacteria bacterium]
RALILGALAVGESRIEGLLEAEDVLGTATALGLLGAELARESDGTWRVWGRGLAGLAEPDQVLDLGNSGTGARLLSGVLAAHPFGSVLTGDASLRRRPMGRVIDPLSQMGARFETRDGGRLPMTIVGSDDLVPIEYRLPVPSAQVKSAVLLAGLHAPGRTAVVEPAPTRDHTERLMRHFGAEVTVDDGPEGRRVSATGQPELAAAPVVVPGDPSSAAFPTVAALLVPGSEVTLRRVGTNPLRTGLYETLAEMGADLVWSDERIVGGEPAADLRVRASRLRGVEVPAERAPRMIDEYPVLAMAAACAEGTTVMRGLGELRVKESDRLALVARGLESNGVAVEAGADTLSVHGRGGPPAGGVSVDAVMDHRIAMSFLVLGLASERPVTVDGAAAAIVTSFPGFAATMASLGAPIREDRAA